MLEALIREAAERFGLGSNAKRLIGLLLNAIFNPSTGGFAGFQKKFEDAGLGSLFSSWIGATPRDNVLQPDQVAMAFDGNILSGIANKIGIPGSKLNIAIAGLLPKLIGLLTEGGRVPTSMPAFASNFVSSLDGPDPLRRDAPAPAKRSDLGWLKWLLLLAAILALGYCMLNRKPTPAVATAPVATTPETTPAPSAPVAQANPRFQLETFGGGKATVSGQVPTDADRTRLLDALNTAFGSGNVNGDIVVDPATLPAGWIDRLLAALPDLKASGLKLGLDGEKLTLDTSGLPEDQRFALSSKLRNAFGGFEISGLWDKATAALAALAPGYDADNLVKALNLMTVHFDTGSANITRDSLEILGQAAKAIQGAPSGTTFEVGGHTDNTGDAAANLTLSQQRADAVVAKLGELGVAPSVLTATGFGQDKPVADNATEEGRALNRRIEFTVRP